MKFRYDRQIIKDIKDSICLSCSMKSISQNKNLHSRIDLNQYKGKLLLLSAEVDNYWPSKQMRNEIARHAKIDVTHKVLNLSGYPFFEYDKSIKEITSLLKETR